MSFGAFSFHIFRSSYARCCSASLLNHHANSVQNKSSSRGPCGKKNTKRTTSRVRTNLHIKNFAIAPSTGCTLYCNRTRGCDMDTDGVAVPNILLWGRSCGTNWEQVNQNALMIRKAVKMLNKSISRVKLEVEMVKGELSKHPASCFHRTSTRQHKERLCMQSRVIARQTNKIGYESMERRKEKNVGQNRNRYRVACCRCMQQKKFTDSFFCSAEYIICVQQKGTAGTDLILSLIRWRRFA